MNIGINAHLLSSQKGYRSAGIHGYIYNTLVYLPFAAPPDWQLTAMVGKKNENDFEGLLVRHAQLDTEAPLTRILWEQAIQPLSLPKFDLYHAMAFVAPVTPFKPKTVVTVYDLSFVHYPEVLGNARRAYLHRLTEHTCRTAKRVICISQSTARDVVKTFDISPEKIDVAPCGTDFERFKPLPEADKAAFRQAKGLPNRYWLFVGTLEPRKNLTTLIEAYARLSTHDRLPMVIAGGKGWDYEDIFAMVERYNLQNTIWFPGYIPDEELALWYNTAETLLYPSIYEGFGLPVLEAMACNTPVIVSDASSLPEVVGDSAGLCVPPRDVEAWQTALQKAAHDDQWRELAAMTMRDSVSHYTWQNTAQQTVNSYQRALDS